MKRFSLLAAVGGLAVMATACTNMEDMPGPGKDRPQMCTKEYKPVCGGKGMKRKTFGNACEANAAGYSVVKEGSCI
jgi:hypothetical protein